MFFRAFCGRGGGQKGGSSFVAADFQFFKEFLETEVCENYSVEWKRAAFFEFVRLWKLPAAEQWLTQAGFSFGHHPFSILWFSTF